ncbi:MAG TPA: retropepsin-like aspartic protease [Pyrinomonadaceae bacterium]|nr:retropepsin-like aspartic protease [Pyrinomonadaceae bacterium]
MTCNVSLKIRLSFLGWLILVTCICPSVWGSDIRFSSGRSALAIPFELDDNLIYVPVSINGSKPLSFILDTGAFTIVDLSRALELGVKLNHKGQTGGIGEQQQDVFLGAENVSFGLPGVTLSNQRLLAVPLKKVEECVDVFVVDENGRDTASTQASLKGARRKVDGILGAEFFYKFVVEIDYASRLINVYEAGDYKYKGRGEKLGLEVTPQHIFVKAQVFAQGRQALPVKLMVDTGGAMAIALSRRFTDEHQLLPPMERLTATPVCGIAGMMNEKSMLGEIDALQLGSLKIVSPLAEFRRAPLDYEFDGYLGGAVFRRYKVIFDYSRRLMIMEPAGSKVDRK